MEWNGRDIKGALSFCSSTRFPCEASSSLPSELVEDLSIGAGQCKALHPALTEIGRVSDVMIFGYCVEGGTWEAHRGTAGVHRQIRGSFGELGSAPTSRRCLLHWMGDWSGLEWTNSASPI